MLRMVTLIRLLLQLQWSDLGCTVVALIAMRTLLVGEVLVEAGASCMMVWFLVLSISEGVHRALTKLKVRVGPSSRPWSEALMLLTAILWWWPLTLQWTPLL